MGVLSATLRGSERQPTATQSLQWDIVGGGKSLWCFFSQKDYSYWLFVWLMTDCASEGVWFVIGGIVTGERRETVD